MIQFSGDALRDLERTLRREWLETNGIGGFASSTIIGLNTRRYHGLLVAATNPPVGRIVLLSKLEEILIIDGHRIELSANQYHTRPEAASLKHGASLRSCVRLSRMFLP